MNQAGSLGLASVGQDVTIWSGAKIIDPEVISIGDSVIIDDFVFIMGGKRTILGSFIHISSFTSITGGGELIMEDFTTLSGGIRLFTGNDDYVGGSLTNSAVPYPYRLPTRSFVHIKKHAIIGANSVILPDVTIGEGVAIGANSLVKHDCEPWMIYAGSPARIIRPRPKEKILELESALRRDLYDRNGNYIPKNSGSPL
ncbi:MAG: acyltransferase [Microcystis sp. M038S2]|jgi:galactoside O-acetyltransferase|uniref:acyltransferase n=1 Tax=unclassified Microcystis TaxID=2643300 RepID=UPI001193807C|nr:MULTISPECIES: acyltransferase [unclassified Microcystis]NCR57413.1 acyltransferase [Microcystis aeruginosa LL13-06]NCS06037.1 acyltransferase [Microcystis aeruginosa G13-07]TRU59645.1 MAG: acyltransferase [Microcystis aeruginosa Ma_QC_C_20070823_S13D]TRU65178.1 MAG: acyltransferase [Microcystis aeruginosa Ma_QC_C_20070823_S13]MCA2683519.1 acyltransferase [Microcystis sp. M046S2]